MTDTQLMTDPSPRPGSNHRAVALISGAHLYSHLYILLLPPLFPLLKDELNVSFTELGLSITAFSLATGLTQAPVGFLVDRMGARKLLIGALVVQSLAYVVVAALPSYPMLIAMMVVSGFANAIYHPADYSLLNASVDSSRMGRTFSIHTASGYFGGFLAPAITLPLSVWIGWQWAVIACSLSGLVMAALLILQPAALRETAPLPAEATAEARNGGLALLFSLPVLMGLTFYVGLSMFGHGVSDFSVSALGEQYPAGLAAIGIALSAWLLASPIGVLAGGLIADRIPRHDVFSGACFVVLAAALFAVATGGLSLAMVVVALAVAGLMNGIISPSRDLLIREMTPPGSMGKVFGFVSTGFNIGGITAPPLFGYLLDSGDPMLVFWVAGVISLATVPTVLLTGLLGRRAALA